MISSLNYLEQSGRAGSIARVGPEHRFSANFPAKFSVGSDDSRRLDPSNPPIKDGIFGRISSRCFLVASCSGWCNFHRLRPQDHIIFKMEPSIKAEFVHPYQLLPIDKRVKRVLKTTPLFDGHNDLPQQPRAIFHGKIHNNPKFDLEKGFERGMTDIPRLREGMADSTSIFAF